MTGAGDVMGRWFAGAILALSTVCAAPAAALAGPAAMQCTAPREVLRLNAKLINTARAIRRNEELVIVAIGSSSTAGVGASSRENAYPYRLSRELAARWPKLKVRVINEGIGGETVVEMLARFESDVMIYAPHLVIWQTGSNAVLTGQALERYEAALRDGLLRLKAARTDVILMDPQFAPAVIAKPMHQRVVGATAALANDFNVGLFQRFAVMRHWVSSGSVRIEDVVARDRLHMNDASYRCIGRLLAEAVSAAAYADMGLTPADAARPPLSRSY